MSRPSDRNLLFGILALQMDFVAKSDLIEGMQAWLLNKDKTLGELLCERGVLSPENRSLLDPLVDAHIRQHGGEAQHSLAALSSDGGLVVELAHADDDELRHSLSLLPRHEPLLPREVGFPSSAALQEDHDGSDQGKSVAAGEMPVDQSPGELPAARFQETLIPGTLDQMDEPKLRFRILRPHAEGGLGRVHVALDQELNREVAFKEIKFEYARRKDAQSRFVIEAEVTGGLEHPGIVPVYGLGHFDDGRPFYAMRFIRGQSLLDAVRRFYGKASRDKSQPADAPASASAAQPTDKLPYASQRDFRDLINRLIDVCNAMQYAHDRKVLHRDLKPGNIMLGKYGETLVVDWGLAKAVGKDNPLERSSDGELPIVPASGSQSAPTQMGSTLGTPAYMSPEQAEGKLDLLGPPCDIYSLGATLYEILTGQAPLKGLKIPDILKWVINGDIPLPRTINPHAPLALQAVCQKAMAVRPQDRYATAKQLAEDLEAWLADEPVSAFREPLLARSRRWMRRHPALVSSTAACVLMAIAALSILSVVVTGKNEQLASANSSLDTANSQLEATNLALTASNAREREAREQAETNEARAVAGEELAEQNAAEAARQRDAATAAQQLAETNATAARGQTSLALDTLNTVVFDIQRELVNVPRAGELRKKLLGTALAGLSRIADNFAAAGRADRQTSVILSEMGDTVLRVGLSDSDFDFDGVEGGTAVEFARSLYQRFFEIAERLAQADPTDAQAQRDLSVSYNKLGDVSRQTGAVQEAVESYRQALEIDERLAQADPTDAQAQRDLSVSYNNLGDVSLHLQTGAVQEAVESYRQALEIRERLAQADPTDAQAQNDLSISLGNLGDVSLKLGDVEDARNYFTRKRGIDQTLAELDPNNTKFQRDLSISYNKLGNVSLQTGAVQEAVESYRQALEIRERLAQADPTDAQAQRDLMVSRYSLGEVYRTDAQFETAIDQYRHGVTVLERMIESGQNVEQSRMELETLQRLVRQCELGPVAIGDWGTLLAQPADVLPLLLYERCSLLSRENRVTDVAQAAAKLQELAATAPDAPDPDHPETTRSVMLYNAACGYGLCVKLASGWDGRRPESRVQRLRN
jgi:serine/threonine protein kinase/Flp pilus assembly protein TadD